VRLAEALGYATWLVSNHLGRGVAPLTSLAIAAAASTSLCVGSFVFCKDWHHPVLLAQEATTLDQLSAGRFELGLGAGHALHEYRQRGLPVDEAVTRIRRLEEAVRLIKQCLTPEPVSFAGTLRTRQPYIERTSLQVTSKEQVKCLKEHSLSGC
jgi:alkanesulfonate monooxygenase SsuD/methylene tetrahydromethanopterin reductase-like flavin-dependent oxidoreductase (luciferase family)